MNLPLVWRLVRKDLHLHRLQLLGLSVGIPVLGLLVATLGGTRWGFMGLVLMSNALIWLTFFVPLGTVLGERKQKTQVFVMSLPISAIEYTTAKLVVGLIAYLAPWIAYLSTLPLLISRSPVIPAGSLPLLVAVLAFFLLVYVVTSLAAIVTDSVWLSGASPSS
jgi:hypothetical protein